MRKLIRSFLITLLALTLAFTLVCAVVVAMFRVIYVDGESMQPSLESGDWIAAFRVGKLHRGDIVLTNTNNVHKARLIKRLIAFGGETVDIDYETGTVYVDGEALDEPYLADKTILGGDVTFPLTVPDGCVFLLGDNRTNSVDSRYAEIGCVRENDLIGPIVIRLLPLPFRSL
jgi:signal peptidase I